MKSILSAILMVSASLVLLAQGDATQSFEVKISSDSILLGNYLEVRFTAQNIQGQFEPPKFEDFDVVGGPNQSTSMRIINGQTTQTASYSFFIKPKSTGLLHIEPAYFTNEEEQSLETPPMEINCLPNPDGVMQESRIRDGNERLSFDAFPFFHEMPAKPQKKKLKVTKI